MTAFRQQLETMIRENGPMNVGTFMSLAIAHYYSTRDPFGAAGDFTTAPEISQMFGEMIGVFLADSWIKIGSPSPVLLAEAGPGRGTLMADILRATKHVSGFHRAAQIHLIEISPALRERQKATLKDFTVTWHDTLATLPNVPTLFVANEFLDALPIRQLQFQNGQWHERVIGVQDGKLVFGLITSPSDPLPGGEGDIFEFAPARENFVRSIADRLESQKGVALFIDYGHDISAVGDTLQAVKNHAYVDALSEIGEADLTSHVDFGRLAAIAGPVYGPVGQGAFLKNLGIERRAARLGKQDDCDRLVNDAHMGRLFRVMALCHDPEIELSGFLPSAVIPAKAGIHGENG